MPALHLIPGYVASTPCLHSLLWPSEAAKSTSGGFFLVPGPSGLHREVKGTAGGALPSPEPGGGYSGDSYMNGARGCFLHATSLESLKGDRVRWEQSIACMSHIHQT